MTTIGIIIRTLGKTLYLACVLALVACIGAEAVQVAHPPMASAVVLRAASLDRPAYLTRSVGEWRGALPRTRRVSVVDRVTVAGRAAPQDGVWAGRYDPATGDIQVVPYADDLTLAHEYGHALLHDLIAEHTSPSSGALATFEIIWDSNRRTDPSELPPWLRRVFAEYLRLPPDPYGDVYYGSSFSEYFAESFAWTADRKGIGVPPAISAFFSGVEREPSKSATPSLDLAIH